MPGLSRELVYHRLPIKAGFRPYKQSARKFNPKTYDQSKEEIGHLIKANFVRHCRYAEWISNTVPVEKKVSCKLRVLIDFRDLNRATPRDEYSKPIAGILINDDSGYKVISFLDGINQIFYGRRGHVQNGFSMPRFPLFIRVDSNDLWIEKC